MLEWRDSGICKSLDKGTTRKGKKGVAANPVLDRLLGIAATQLRNMKRTPFFARERVLWRCASRKATVLGLCRLELFPNELVKGATIRRADVWTVL